MRNLARGAFDAALVNVGGAVADQSSLATITCLFLNIWLYKYVCQFSMGVLKHIRAVFCILSQYASALQFRRYHGALATPGYSQSYSWRAAPGSESAIVQGKS